MGILKCYLGSFVFFSNSFNSHPEKYFPARPGLSPQSVVIQRLGEEVLLFLRAEPSSWFLGPGHLGFPCLSTTLSWCRQRTARAWQFVPLWQMVGEGSLQNRLKIVLPRRTFTNINELLCATIQTLWPLKNPFSPLKRAPAASGSCGSPQLSWGFFAHPRLVCYSVLDQLAFSMTLNPGSDPGFPPFPFGELLSLRFWDLVCELERGCSPG